jgi:hypothetical protein
LAIRELINFETSLLLYLTSGFNCLPEAVGFFLAIIFPHIAVILIASVLSEVEGANNHLGVSHP